MGEGSIETRAEIKLPDYMQTGSRGKLVIALSIFLQGLGFLRSKDIKLDGNYGSVLTANVRDLQLSLAIEADGNFGPNTRARVKAMYGFDLEEAEAALPPAMTIFVQPDGTEIRYPPSEVETRSSLAAGCPTPIVTMSLSGSEI